jgi:hypothetical protein
MGLHARLNKITNFLARADARLFGSWTRRERDQHERRLTEAFLRACDRRPEWGLSPGLQSILDAAEAATPTPGWAGPEIDPARLDAAVRESVRQRGGKPFVPITARDVLASPAYQARLAAGAAMKGGRHGFA